MGVLRNSLPVLFLCCVLGVPAPAFAGSEDPEALAAFRLELNRAVRQFEVRARRCEPRRVFPESLLESLAHLELDQEALSSALIWLSVRADHACMAPAERDLALTVARYRQAAQALGAGTKPADAAAQLAWGSVHHEPALSAAWQGLPESRRRRLESIEFLRKPFDPLRLLDALESRR